MDLHVTYSTDTLCDGDQCVRFCGQFKNKICWKWHFKSEDIKYLMTWCLNWHTVTLCLMPSPEYKFTVVDFCMNYGYGYLSPSGGIVIRCACLFVHLFVMLVVISCFLKSRIPIFVKYGMDAEHLCIFHCWLSGQDQRLRSELFCHKKPKHSKAQSTMPTSRDVRDKPWRPL